MLAHSQISTTQSACLSRPISTLDDGFHSQRKGRKFSLVMVDMFIKRGWGFFLLLNKMQTQWLNHSWEKSLRNLRKRETSLFLPSTLWKLCWRRKCHQEIKQIFWRNWSELGVSNPPGAFSHTHSFCSCLHSVWDRLPSFGVRSGDCSATEQG